MLLHHLQVKVSRLGHSLGLPTCSPAQQTPTRGCCHSGLPSTLVDHFTSPSSSQAAFALCPPDKSSSRQPEPHVNTHTHISALTGVLSSFLSHSSSSLSSSSSYTQAKKKKQHTHTHNTHFQKRRAGTVYFHLFQVPAQFESISD